MIVSIITRVICAGAGAKRLKEAKNSIIDALKPGGGRTGVMFDWPDNRGNCSGNTTSAKVARTIYTNHQKSTRRNLKKPNWDLKETNQKELKGNPKALKGMLRNAKEPEGT